MRFILALLCGISLTAQAETFNAKVIVVMDGDTVMVLRKGGGEAAGYPPASPLRGLRDSQKLKVRLANIDAPEKDQSFGMQSRDSLLQLVGKKQVQIDSQAVDQYGRMIGQISVDGLDVNQEQVKRGMAWEYSHYHSDKTYIGLQSEAQQARRGLWAQTSPLAPWQWRKLHPSTGTALHANKQATSSQATPTLLYDMECGKKRYCAEMTSCDEAHFYLTRCAVMTLDQNRDGVPCEKLCSGKK